MKTSILLAFITATILLVAFAEGNDKGNGRSTTVALAGEGGDGKGNG